MLQLRSCGSRRPARRSTRPRRMSSDVLASRFARRGRFRWPGRWRSMPSCPTWRGWGVSWERWRPRLWWTRWRPVPGVRA